MRLLMFCDPVLFGHNWADAAAAAMEVVRLQVSNSNVDGKRPGTLTELGERTFAYSLPTDQVRWRRPADAVTRVRSLVRVHDELLRRFGPFDAAVVHFFARAGTAAVLRRFRQLPAIVIEHSSALTGANPEQVGLDEAKRRATRAYRRADGIVFVSPTLAQHAHSLDVVPPTARVAVIPNPVDTGVFRPPDVAPPAAPLRVVCVARLAPVKRQAVLVDAMAELRGRGVQAHLTLVGDGPEREALTRQCHHLGLSDAVEFLGWQEPAQVADVLQRCHVFALPSITENLPFAVIEAMCTGLPVVATPVGGVPGLLEGHPSVLLASVDPGEVADAICQLASSPIDRNAAAAAAAERFGYPSVGEQFAQFVRSVVP